MEGLIKNIILNSEENVGFIGDAEEIAEVVFDLQDDGVCFYLNDEEISDMVDDSDILQITKIVCENCEKVEYHLERVLDDEDYTIYDELDLFIIDSNILDIVDLEQLDGEIVVVELQIEDEECYGDCENCTLYEDDENFEDYDEESMGVLLADEFLDSLEEIDEDDGEEVYDLIVEYMQMAYQAGRDDSLAELTDAIDSIKALR